MVPVLFRGGDRPPPLKGLDSVTGDLSLLNGLKAACVLGVRISDRGV